MFLLRFNNDDVFSIISIAGTITSFFVIYKLLSEQSTGLKLGPLIVPVATQILRP